MAVDRGDVASGPSGQAELAHPLIVTASIPPGKPSSQYFAQVKVSASAGHLVSADENGKAYQMLFRNGDSLNFSLSGAPGISSRVVALTTGVYADGPVALYALM